jgi:hypothetical protein
MPDIAFFRGEIERVLQAIIVAIDQYAEAATGNREFFLNKPPSVAGKTASTSACLGPWGRGPNSPHWVGPGSEAHCESEQRNACAALGAQIDLSAMDAPDALFDDQHRYRAKLMARCPFTSFDYCFLVV